MLALGYRSPLAGTDFLPREPRQKAVGELQDLSLAGDDRVLAVDPGKRPYERSRYKGQMNADDAEQEMMARIRDIRSNLAEGRRGLQEVDWDAAQDPWNRGNILKDLTYSAATLYI